MAERIRMTRTTLDVLDVLLQAVQEDLHGLEICRRSGLGTGTVYPILARLERADWVRAEWEPENEWQHPADGKRRPRRRLYELSGTGRAAASAAMREFYARRGIAWRDPVTG